MSSRSRYSPESIGGDMPPGIIVTWYGAIANIPAGWTLCDGGDTPTGLTTPDLRDKFVIGAGSSIAVGANDVQHTHIHGHNFTLPSHSHGEGDLEFDPNDFDTIEVQSGTGATTLDPDGNDVELEGGDTGSRSLTIAGGVTAGQAALPPYHGLAYIMKD